VIALLAGVAYVLALFAACVLLGQSAVTTVLVVLIAIVGIWLRSRR
jgi:hypothetical protein